MNGAGAAVAAEDFKKLLTRHGLNLIAERVEDEKTVVQLLDYAVDYAQGYLFGEPRAVREEFAQAGQRAGTGGGDSFPQGGLTPLRIAGIDPAGGAACDRFVALLACPCSPPDFRPFRNRLRPRRPDLRRLGRGA